MHTLPNEKLVVFRISDIKKFQNLLSMAVKAGKTQLGFDAAKAAITSCQASLLIISNEISLGTKSSIISKAQQASVGNKIILFSLEELLRLVGRRVGIIAITDSGFAKALNDLIVG